MATKWKSKFRELKYLHTNRLSQPVAELGRLPIPDLQPLAVSNTIKDIWIIDDEQINETDRYFDHMESSK